jgi:hypothetical protein
MSVKVIFVDELLYLRLITYDLRLKYAISTIYKTR